jgi:hypothetical protein
LAHVAAVQSIPRSAAREPQCRALKTGEEVPEGASIGGLAPRSANRRHVVASETEARWLERKCTVCSERNFRRGSNIHAQA